jgi:hypothetical protein
MALTGGPPEPYRRNVLTLGKCGREIGLLFQTID